MTMSIIDRIGTLKYSTWAEIVKEPNTLYINMSDYRLLCDAAKGYWLPRVEKPVHLVNKVPLEQKFESIALTQFMLMKIVKKAGQMRCTFEPN